MDDALIRWQRLPGWSRILLLLLVALGYALIWLQMALQPRWQRIEQLQQSLTQQTESYQQRLQRLQQQLPLEQVTADTLRLQTALAALKTDSAPTFDLTALLENSGGTLEKWTPQLDGAELALQLEWSQLLRLYHWLLARPVSRLPGRLDLKPQDDRLSATFWWTEPHDET
ncbi:hypothetical protein [Duffyella gerundensis]|uniref:HofO family protein n=1 Tax=Duffyella gerundensis TaxID=1619313 RepID=UPI0021F79A1A|nr:hypothetical protein [Duffyella gerundensis]